MGRVCNGPRLLWAEFVMGRDVPEPPAPAIKFPRWDLKIPEMPT